MREGWTYKGFEDCLIKAKKTKQVQTSEYNIGTKYPIISQEDKMVSGYCDDESLLYHINCPVVVFGDHTRVLKYVDFDFVVGADGVKILIPKPFLKAKFLYYYLQWYKVPSLGYSRHYKLLKEISLPIPSPEVQQRIVSELDLLSSIIEKKKAQLKEYDQLAQSIFYDMFGDPVTNEKGWKVKKLGEVAKEKLSYGSGASAIHYNNEVRYVRITDIKDDGELNSDMVSPNIYDEKYLLNDGDILFARSGATVGKTFLYKAKYGKCIYAGYLIRLIPNTKIVLPSYVYGFTKSSYYRSFVAKVQNAVAQPNINAKQYSELSIPLPPLPLQQSFASKIEAIEHQKALVQQSITETESLFNSRMDYYFD